MSPVQSIQVEDNSTDALSADYKNIWILHENGDIVVLTFKQYPKPEFEIDRLIKYKLFNHEPINDLIVVTVNALGPSPGEGPLGSHNANSSSFAQGSVELTATLTNNKELSSETHRETVIYVAGANPTLSVYNISKAAEPAPDINKLALSVMKEKVAGMISKTFKSWWSSGPSAAPAAAAAPTPVPKEFKEETILLTSQVSLIILYKLAYKILY